MEEGSHLCECLLPRPRRQLEVVGGKDPRVAVHRDKGVDDGADYIGLEIREVGFLVGKGGVCSINDALIHRVHPEWADDGVVGGCDLREVVCLYSRGLAGEEVGVHHAEIKSVTRNRLRRLLEISKEPIVYPVMITQLQSKAVVILGVSGR